MKLSKNFTRKEFKCKCGQCDYDTVDAELIVAIQDIRDHFGRAVTITSGNRCPTYNNKIGGAINSYHPRGRAADIVVTDVAPRYVYDYLNKKYPEAFGLGKYDDFTHIDTRSQKARW